MLLAVEKLPEGGACGENAPLWKTLVVLVSYALVDYSSIRIKTHKTSASPQTA